MSPVVKQYHPLPSSIMCEGMVSWLIWWYWFLSNVSKPTRINYFTWKYNILKWGRGTICLITLILTLFWSFWRIRNGFEKKTSFNTDSLYSFETFNVESNTIFYTDCCRVFLTSLSMVTAPETPRGAGCPSGTKDLRETIGKMVTVVQQEVVCSIRTAVVPGTPLDAVEA